MEWGASRRLGLERKKQSSPNSAQLESLASTNTNKQSVCLYPTFLLEQQRGGVIFGMFCHCWRCW